jgi:hypothetical protein
MNMRLQEKQFARALETLCFWSLRLLQMHMHVDVNETLHGAAHTDVHVSAELDGADVRIRRGAQCSAQGTRLCQCRKSF